MSTHQNNFEAALGDSIESIIFNLLFKTSDLQSEINSILSILCNEFSLVHISIYNFNSISESLFDYFVPMHSPSYTYDYFLSFQKFLECNQQYLCDDEKQLNHCKFALYLKSYYSNEQFYYYCLESNSNTSFNEETISKVNTCINIITFFMNHFEMHKQLLETHLFDPLTKAYNLIGISQKFDEIILEQNSLDYCGVFLNINNFKLINLKYGFQIGNVALIEIANKIVFFLSKHEFLSRLGGDNFFLLLRQERLEELIQLLNQFHIYLSTNESPSIYQSIQFTFGIYLVTDTTLMTTEIIELSTIAFREAKQSKALPYKLFDRKLQDKVLSERKILASMSSAIDSGEFVVYYQPKYDLISNKIVGAEALARWINSDGKLITPSEFIPLFESNGFICDLDYYIFESVCRHMSYWIKLFNKTFPISVNFSKQHLLSNDFLPRLKKIASKHNVSPSYLEIELTESTFFENTTQITTAVIDFKKEGFSVSMDDFGVGYSSLNLLKDIPVDILKIDKEFLKKGLDTKRERIILSNIIKMSKELDIIVISEGVETKDESEYLATIGCDMAQGFYFSKPLPIDQFEKLAYHF